MSRIDTLMDFLKKSPEEIFLKHALALEYVKLDDDRQARLIFQELLAANPDYVGSYYHLGKLLERTGETAQAISVFENGMLKAKELGDQHAFNELRSAHEDLTT